MFRSLTKRLLCPVCAVVVADASYRGWPGQLMVWSPDGSRIVPTRGVVAVEQAERDLADASTAEEAQDARRRLERISANRWDVWFRLRCRNGHTVTRTGPDLLEAARRARGSWVPLS
jgi:hypothetical protein